MPQIMQNVLQQYVSEVVKLYGSHLNPKEIGRRITGAEAIRYASDYDDFYIASREETEKQIAVAEAFIKLVEEYCSRRLDNAEMSEALESDKNVRIL